MQLHLENCETCRYGKKTGSFEQIECRRHAPIVLNVEHHVNIYGQRPQWPFTRTDDWCGDYWARESENEF